MTARPTLPAGFHPVPPGHVATVVTYLEMTAPPDAPPPPAPEGVALTSLADATPGGYRALFRRVGAPWLWFSRLRMAEDALAATLAHPDYAAFALEREGVGLGLLELDFRAPGACELAFFGLVPEATGMGLGRWLMAEGIARAFARPIARLHVHTCTLDSPAALPFYLRAGFRAVRQEVEIAPDPRLAGELPRAAAPQVPIL